MLKKRPRKLPPKKRKAKEWVTKHMAAPKEWPQQPFKL